jgi:hypothetical protein
MPGPIRRTQPHLHRLETLRDEASGLFHQFIRRSRQPQPAALIRRHRRSGAAEQPIQRQARGLAEHIPQRAVERRDRDHRDALVAEEVDVLPGPRPEIGDVTGVAADHQIGEFVDHLAQHVGASVVEREDQILAADAGIGPDRDENAAEPLDPSERTADWIFELDQHRLGFDRGYLHRALRSSLSHVKFGAPCF